MRAVLGTCFIVAPFVAGSIMMVERSGWQTMLHAWGFVVLIVAPLGIGVWLLHERSE